MINKYDNMRIERIGCWDILKGIGIILMVMGHIGFGNSFSCYIHAFHMPLFFFVSGYFFRPEKYPTVKHFFKKNAKSLLLPYIIFVLMCQILHFIYTNDWSCKYFLLSLISSNHNRIDVAGAYWFLLCMFSVRFEYYLLSRYFKGISLTIAVIILTFISNMRLVKLPFCLDSASSMLLIFHMAYLYCNYKDRFYIKKLFNVPNWTIPIIIVLNAFMIFANPDVNIRTNSVGIIPLFWINVFVAIYCYIRVSMYIEITSQNVFFKIKGFLHYIGENSIVYLLLNEIVIFMFQFVLERLWPNTSILKNILILFLSLMIIRIASIIINNTKLRIIIGK